jgi:hypothetical protein
MATTCPSCGWSFPEVPAAQPRTSWAYSKLATLALLVGMVASLLWAIAAAYRSVTSLLSGELLTGLVDGSLVFFLAFAMFVLFARALDSEKR